MQSFACVCMCVFFLIFFTLLLLFVKTSWSPLFSQGWPNVLSKVPRYDMDNGLSRFLMHMYISKLKMYIFERKKERKKKKHYMPSMTFFN